MSMSTACISVCSASQSSSMDVSLAMAVGVATVVLSSGSFERSASIPTSAGGVKPPVMRTQGKSSVSASRSDSIRADGLEALEIADLAFAEDQHPARLQILVKAGEREPGLLDVGAGDAPVEAQAAGEQLERQAGRLRAAVQERAYRDTRTWRHLSATAGQHGSDEARAGR